MHRVGSREVQALEGDALAPSAVLLGAIEPEPFEGLVVQQGTDGGDARPVSKALDQSLLTAVRQHVAEPLDLGRLLLADRDGLVPAPQNFSRQWIKRPASRARFELKWPMKNDNWWLDSTRSKRWK
jgi:hypothetical protein